MRSCRQRSRTAGSNSRLPPVVFVRWCGPFRPSHCSRRRAQRHVVRRERHSGWVRCRYCQAAWRIARTTARAPRITWSLAQTGGRVSGTATVRAQDSSILNGRLTGTFANGLLTYAVSCRVDRCRWLARVDRSDGRQFVEQCRRFCSTQAPRTSVLFNSVPQLVDCRRNSDVEENASSSNLPSKPGGAGSSPVGRAFS